MSSLAKLIGVPAPLLSQWATGARRVPVARCIQIHEITRGKVRCDELRPDFPWEKVVRFASAGTAGSI